MAEHAQVGARARSISDGKTAGVRRRPKNRKAQIAAVAAEAFSERGYHGVSIDEIAKTVGISGPALYRHFPNKYALFRHAVNELADSLGAAVDEFDSGDDTDPSDTLDRLLTATIRTTITNRRTGGLYRWERRYLSKDDRLQVRGKMVAINRRLAQLTAQLRPDLTASDYVVLSTALLSTIGSITTHRAPLSNRRLQQLLLDACHSILATPLAPADPDSGEPPTKSGLATSNKREVLLHEAVLLFDAHGYHDVSIEEIGAAAGINASGVYRHFPSKADLLATAFHRAGDRVAMSVESALTESSTSDQALEHLVDVFVRLAFDHSELMSVYFAEIGNLPKAHRSDLRNIQRLNIEEWARIVAELRTDLSAVECRFLVHAALILSLDVGQVMRFRSTESNRRRVQQLMLAVLVGNRSESGEVLRP